MVRRAKEKGIFRDTKRKIIKEKIGLKTILRPAISSCLCPSFSTGSFLCNPRATPSASRRYVQRSEIYETCTMLGQEESWRWHVKVQGRAFWIKTLDPNHPIFNLLSSRVKLGLRKQQKKKRYFDYFMHLALFCIAWFVKKLEKIEGTKFARKLNSLQSENARDPAFKLTFAYWWMTRKTATCFFV